MKKIIMIILILVTLLTVAFSSAISLKDIYIGWFEPSDLNTWTAPWMLPVLYNEATNTTAFSAYYRNESGPYTLNVLGAYVFHKFIGGDYMRATVNASYTTFRLNRYTVGIAVPNAGFDIRYVNAMDGNLHYYDEIGMDIEFIYNWNLFWPFNMFSHQMNNNKSESRIFSYVKLFNFVRYIKPAYPSDSQWKTIFSMDYLFRTVWVLPQFALIYDKYNGIDEISYQPESYNAIEMLFKPTDNMILRGGVNFEESGSSAVPSVNVGARFTFKKFNINADYQRVLAEPTGTFAISAGTSF